MLLKSNITLSLQLVGHVAQEVYEVLEVRSALLLRLDEALKVFALGRLIHVQRQTLKIFGNGRALFLFLSRKSRIVLRSGLDRPSRNHK